MVDAADGGLYRTDDAGESWHLVNNQRRLWGHGSDELLRRTKRFATFWDISAERREVRKPSFSSGFTRFSGLIGNRGTGLANRRYRPLSHLSYEVHIGSHGP